MVGHWDFDDGLVLGVALSDEPTRRRGAPRAARAMGALLKLVALVWVIWLIWPHAVIPFVTAVVVLAWRGCQRAS